MKYLLPLLLLPSLALAQNVQQSGPVTPGQLAVWGANGVVRSGGTATNGNATSLGLLGAGLPFCINDAPVASAGGYHQLCLGANASGGGLLSYNAYGGAAQLPMQFNVNGAGLATFTGFVAANGEQSWTGTSVVAVQSTDPPFNADYANNGPTIGFTPNYTNAGALAMTIGPQPASPTYPVQKYGPSGLTALTGGEMQAGVPYLLTWTGAVFVLQSGYTGLIFGTPASASATCVKGQIEFDATYIYTCIATNSWHRLANGASW